MGALLLLVMLLVLVPLMVVFVQNEAKWTAKAQKNTTAFQLAEAATEKGYWKISQSTVPTQLLPITGYRFDVSYSELGGTYTVNVGSDGAKNIIITGVGRSANKSEVRAIKVVYAPPQTTQSSLLGTGAVPLEVSGAAQVEWGPIYTQASISGTNKTYPRLFAVGGGPPDVIANYCLGDCSQHPPCTDSIHYWCCSCVKFNSNPNINLDYYKNLAQSYGVSPPSGCGRAGSCPGTAGTESYYNPGCFSRCTDTSGRVYYNDTGDITFDSAGTKNFIVGSVILAVGSSINMNGSVGSGSYAAAVPPYAWREYGLDSTTWSHYRSFDGGAPATFPGLNAAYTPAAGTTKSLSNVVVHGLLYDAGDMNCTGGANNVIHGVAIVQGATINGGYTVYYDSSTADTIQWSGRLPYTRTSWRDLPSQSWPSGLP